MKLPLPFFRKEQPREYFLALLLHDESIRAVIFEEEAGEMRLVHEHEAMLPQSLEEVQQDVLLQTADTAISTAETALPTNIQTHRTIFGLKESWVEQTAIKKERLVILKQLCSELDLQPLGFLVFSEAIAHLLQRQEGAPVSGILVEIGTSIFTVTLLRAGRIVEVRQSSLDHQALPGAVDALLQEFTNAEILPSRIILFDPQKRPHLLQSFLHHHWTKTLPFLHVPQITTLEEGFDTQAILYGTASQMGFTMNDIPAKMQKHIPLSEEDTQEETKKEENQKQSEAEKSEEKGEDFGFIVGKDVLEEGKGNGNTEEGKEPAEEEPFAVIPEEVKEQEEGKNGINGTFLIEGAKNIMKKLRMIQLRKPKESHMEHTSPATHPLLLFLIPGILLILLGIILWYILGLSAVVTISLSPDVISNTTNVTFSTSDPTDISGHIIGGSSVSVDENGTATVQATGTKDVGNKAKGTVTIYNLSDSAQTYPGGTTITSSNGLKFTLSNTVSVASGSSDPINPVAGKTDAPISASDIGTDYNLPSGTKFSIGSNANVAAQNSSALSGGTKKSVTVVSAEDIAKLTDNLINSLKGKAQNDLHQKTDSTKGILSVFLKTDLTKKSYDNQTGTQASTVTLNGTVTFTAVAYQQSDLASMAKSALQSKIAQDHLAGHGISEDIASPSVKDNSVTAQVTFKASLLPAVDTTGLAKQIAGKSYTQAQTIFSSLPQYSSQQIILSPNLFFLPQYLPRLSSHIHIVIKSDE